MRLSADGRFEPGCFQLKCSLLTIRPGEMSRFELSLHEVTGKNARLIHLVLSKLDRGVDGNSELKWLNIVLSAAAVMADCVFTGCHGAAIL